MKLEDKRYFHHSIKFLLSNAKRVDLKLVRVAENEFPTSKMKIISGGLGTSVWKTPFKVTPERRS